MGEIAAEDDRDVVGPEMWEDDLNAKGRNKHKNPTKATWIPRSVVSALPHLEKL